MDINASDWHYKYVSRHWVSYPRSFCGYFWRVVFTIFFGLVVMAVGSIIIYEGLLSFTSPLWQLWWQVSIGQQIAAFCIWLFIGVTALTSTRKWELEVGRYVPPVKERKSPGLVRQFIRAKHERVCPRLVYKPYD